MDGKEEFKLASPVFKQNLYSGVYDDLHPRALPEYMNFFAPDLKKYPNMQAALPYILDTTLEKGDCLYIPELYYF